MIEIPEPKFEHIEAKSRRMFIGVRVSMATTNQLAAAADTLARRASQAGLAVRWISPSDYHLTLKFLGWVHSDTIGAVADAVTRALTSVALQPFSIDVARLGAFPSKEKGDVIWAGVQSNVDRLRALATAIDRETAELGFPAEVRPFHPHVTLGRLRSCANVSDAILPLSEQAFSETRVSEIELLESVIVSNKSTYALIEKIPLFSPETPIKRQTAPLEPGPRQANNSSPHIPDTDDGWPRGQGPSFDIPPS